MKRLIDKARTYARSYGQPPYGEEIEGTAELLLQMADKLEEYENLETQGKLLKLPCAVGDTVYAIEHFQVGDPMIIATHADSFCCALWTLGGRFGRCIFPTLEEAEAALKNQKNEGKK